MIEQGSKDDRPEVIELLQSIKKNMNELSELLIKSDQVQEEIMYRFYHQSFKIFGLIEHIKVIIKALHGILPRTELNLNFLHIIDLGIAPHFDEHTNSNWLTETRPIIEAFSHAHYFLKMTVKYGKKLEYPPSHFAAGWGAVLYLFNLR